jgi:hypothetical protein
LGTDHPLPFVPASDAAGMVAAVGSHAHRFKVGDRITTHVIPRWLRGQVLSPEESPSLGLPLPGVPAAYVLLDEDGAVQTPAYLSDQEARPSLSLRSPHGVLCSTRVTFSLARRFSSREPEAFPSLRCSWRVRQGRE